MDTENKELQEKMQDVIFEVRTLSSIVFLNFFLVTFVVLFLAAIAFFY